MSEGFIPPDGGPARLRRFDWAACAFLVIATLAVYARVLGCGFVNFDDDLYVTKNYHVQQGLTWAGVVWAFTTGHAANWHPVTWLSHMLDCQIYGMRPWGHHLTNLLLHTANTLLVYAFFRRTTRRTWASLAVAAIFAGHPLHVESVAWVAERKDVLSAFFGLLALIAYSWYAKSRDALREAQSPSEGTCTFPEDVAAPPPASFPRRRESSSVDRQVAPQALGSRLRGNDGEGFAVCLLILTLALFAVGLMAKPMLVTLPFVFLLVDVWPLERFPRTAPLRALFGREYRRLLVEKIPFVAVSALSAAITMVVQHRGGAMGSLERYPLSLRLQTACAAYLHYFWQTVEPIKLAIFYPYPVDGVAVGSLVLAAALLVSGTAAAICLRRRAPWAFTGWFWFAGMLVPVIGVIQVGEQAYADRYMYLPILGLAIAIVFGFPTGRTRGDRIVIRLTQTSWLLGLFLLTLMQIGWVWTSNVRLWENAAAYTKHNALAYLKLGNLYADAGSTTVAAGMFERALEARPGYFQAYNNLAKLELGKPDGAAKAVELLEKALANNPRYVDANVNMGIALASLNRVTEATRYFETAVAADPENIEANYNYAAALYQQQRYAEAAQHFARALEGNPQDAAAEFGWAMALIAQSDWAGAEAHLDGVLEKQPGHTEARKYLEQLRGRRSK